VAGTGRRRAKQVSGEPVDDAAARRDESRRRLATAAMFGVVLYVVTDIVLQLLPPHYSPISEAESNLAVGPFGWIMNLNFLARAALSGCAIAALARVTTPDRSGTRIRLRNTGLVLFGLAGLCSAALAFFATDVAQAGEHGVGTTTTTGAIHLALATGGFVVALVAFAVLTVWMRDIPELRSGYRQAQAFLIVAVVGIVSLGGTIAFAPAVLGLAERLCLAGILGWAFVVSAAVRRA
jgi:hypothetical membrane protein